MPRGPKGEQRPTNPFEAGAMVGRIATGEVSDSKREKFAERQNLTMRMSMRRFTRLTNAFSKKFENHCHAQAIYFFWYNWTRIHKTLGFTPAMAAGLTDKLLSMSDLAEMVDAALPRPGKRGLYKKRLAA